MNETNAPLSTRKENPIFADRYTWLDRALYGALLAAILIVCWCAMKQADDNGGTLDRIQKSCVPMAGPNPTGPNPNAP